MAQKAKAKAAISQPLFPVAQNERYVFQRQLGHPEILHSNKWEDTLECRCTICNKYCYTTVIWNHRVQTDGEMRMKYWKQSLAEPVAFSGLEQCCPVLVVNGKMVKMTPLREFVERLQSGKKDKRLNLRSCDNEFEEGQL